MWGSNMFSSSLLDPNTYFTTVIESYIDVWAASFSGGGSWIKIPVMWFADADQNLETS